MRIILRARDGSVGPVHATAAASHRLPPILPDPAMPPPMLIRPRHPTPRLAGIPKLDDANDAGGRNSERCTLILTEGDSAKALAVSGLSVVGRDKFGVFPLRWILGGRMERVEVGWWYKANDKEEGRCIAC